MLDGIMLLWFVLAAAAVLFVAIDIRTTPESPVMKWGFVLVTAFIGVVGAFLYVLGCREPLPDTHERYVAVQWRQALGSTMHCAAGDGVGILAGAAFASAFQLSALPEIALEYLLGFGFGWMVFQALFMRRTAGGSYSRSLANTFIPELLSMNLLMAGMAPTMMILRGAIGEPAGPGTPVFWFVMSMALLVGFAVAYPMNWWLVHNHLKHGMLTVRPASAMPTATTPGLGSHGAHSEMPAGRDTQHAAMPAAEPPWPAVPTMVALSLVVLGAGIGVVLVASRT
jgi:hypothetical protein